MQKGRGIGCRGKKSFFHEDAVKSAVEIFRDRLGPGREVILEQYDREKWQSIKKRKNENQR